MVKIINFTIPSLSGKAERRVYIYLPASYTNNAARYPVMYMFDGHNVFFDKDATYGKSWGMKTYMDRTCKQLIIVAVECNHHGYCRLAEYSPVNFSYPGVGRIVGRGEEYMKWLIYTLKPYIDFHYRTLPNRENTYICGSSMGGLMALYGICKFNQIFHKAACLSPSLWISPKAVIELIRESEVSKDTCIYMDYGSDELQNNIGTLEVLRKTTENLMLKNTKNIMRIVPGGTHCEASWEQRIPEFMNFLAL